MKLAVIAAVGLVATAAYAGGLPDADEADGRELRTTDSSLAEDDGARGGRAAWIRRMRAKFAAMMRRKRAARRQARRHRRGRSNGRGRRGRRAPCSGRQTGQTVKRTSRGSVKRRFEQCADGSRQLVTETRRDNNDRWMTISTDRRWRGGQRQRTSRRVPYTPGPELDNDNSNSDSGPGSDPRRQSPDEKFGSCQFGAVRLSCGRCACDSRKFKTWRIDGAVVCTPHGAADPRTGCSGGKLADVTNTLERCSCPKGRTCTDEPAVDPTDPTDPTEPVDPTDPTDPAEPADPSDPSDSDEPAVVDPAEPAVVDPAEPADPSDPSDSDDDPPVVVDPTVHPVHPVTPGPEVDMSKMRMAGKVELEAFVAQNAIRTDPRSFVDDVAAEMDQFVDDRKMRQASGVMLMTNEGIGAWREAKRSLEQQPAFAPFEWSDYLALAAQDHCRDQGPSGATGHRGSRGSSPFKRMERYGRWERSAAENIAYGRGSGEAFMLQLYIDDGVANRGHRKTMLSDSLRLVGMAHCPHAKYGSEIVAAYAVGFTPSPAGEAAVAARAIN